MFPDPEVSEAGKSVTRGSNASSTTGAGGRKKLTRLETTRLEAMGSTQRKSAFQWKFQKVRVEAFVSLFNRCVEPPMLCTPECLYRETLFGSDGVAEICKRLGRMRTFDALHCSQAMNHIRSSATLSEKTRLARTMKLLKGAKNAEKAGDKEAFLRGMTPQNGRSHELNLGIYEDSVCASFLVQLSNLEKGENLKNCYWSEHERGEDEEEDEDFVIPPRWAKQVPTEGELHLTYVSEKPEFIDTDARRALAETLFGWEVA
jgi:hypothetical protein